MCGISGGWHSPALPDQVIVQALDAIAHRGPTDYGFRTYEDAFIGMRRLSIIDLAGGHQPLYNEDCQIGIIFNGEIYNYLELIPDLKARGHVFQTRSDTEVLLHLYEEYGPDMCRFLRGMFVFTILDMRQNILFAARDHYGKKPLYYTRTPSGGILFASEIKALRVLAKEAHAPLQINEQAIYDYLSLGSVPQPDTIYRNVHALPSGSWMRFDGHDLKIEQFWHVDYRHKAEIPYPEALERVRSIISEAVRIRLRSDVPLGVLLSGGIDSSIVAYEAAREVGDTLKTFTVGVNDTELNEADVARRTAKTLGVQNIILPMQIDPRETLPALVRQYDQPFADPSAMPSMAISKLAREHVTVALNGDGGDELFAGYRRYVATQMTDSLSWIPAPAARMAAATLNRVAPTRRSALGHAARLARTLSYSEGERYIARTMDMLLEQDKADVWRGPKMRPTEEWIESVPTYAENDLDIQLSRDVQIILQSTLLVKMDIATMAASLEGRSPMMDYVLGEFAMSLPPQYLTKGTTTKILLRDAYRGLLPNEVIDGKKKGFEIPLRAWLDNELRPMINDTLATPGARVRRYLTDSYVDQVVAGTTLQDRNAAYLLYSLLILELWLREFGE
jgi:asparagine synthase (glutamine-hydrolysing)